MSEKPTADESLEGIMADMQKLADTPVGAIQVQHLTTALAELHKLDSDEKTKPHAKEILEKWGAGEYGELRKRIANHWINRAEGLIANPAAAGTATADPDVRIIHTQGRKAVKTHPVIAAYRARVTTGNQRGKVFYP